MAGDETASQSWGKDGGAGVDPVPGLLLLFSGTQPQLASLPLSDEPLQLGRGSVGGLPIEDGCLSRRHAEVAKMSGRVVVRDLESRNGTFLDGERLTAEREARPGQLVRVGDTLLLVVADARSYLGASVELLDGVVIGPTLRRVWDAVGRAATEGDCLHIVGETGSGKELAARHFHRASGRGDQPFSAVNCATIPPLIAERLLFGARKGAYSGAVSDADGYMQSADGGTLFLDEIADLGPTVQAKLLRAIESREVLPLGATRPRRVDVRLCSATHQDLKDEVAQGRFRPDLYYRVGRPSVRVPPLRERREDVPWLIQSLLAKRSGPFEAHASLVEAVLNRPWPGNVRELATEIVNAASQAQADGARTLRASHLDRSAGLPFVQPQQAEVSRGPPTAEVVQRALEQNGGNVTAAARTLGLHRTQLRRLIARYQLVPRAPPRDD